MAMPRRWPREYYSYAMFDRKSGEPYYVGAGKGNRGNPNLKYFQGRLSGAECDRLKKDTWVLIIEHESKEFAFLEEERLILLYGRIDLGTGPLLNRTNGRGARGRVWTQDQRDRIAAAQRGVPMLQSHREIIRKSMKGNKHLLGFKHSEETKKKISVASKKYWEERMKKLCG